MAGCCVVLLSPIIAAIGLAVFAFMILRLAFEAVVGTVALPLLVVSIVCGVAAAVLAGRALWLRFHDHQEIDLVGVLVLPAVLAVIAFVAFCVALVVSGFAFAELFQGLLDGDASVLGA